MEKLTVLVVDDDREIVESIAIFLQADGYLVRKAYNGLEALDIVMTENIHLIILDIMMPELDGIKTLLKVRESKNLPIILLSAKSEDADKILGLTAGADDYITKPFNPSELVARVKSQLRRYTQLGAMQIKETQIAIRGLVLDTESKSVTVDGEAVRLHRLNTKYSSCCAVTRARCSPPRRFTGRCGMTISSATTPSPSMCGTSAKR